MSTQTEPRLARPPVPRTRSDAEHYLMRFATQLGATFLAVVIAGAILIPATFWYIRNEIKHEGQRFIDQMDAQRAEAAKGSNAEMEQAARESNARLAKQLADRTKENELLVREIKEADKNAKQAREQAAKAYEDATREIRKLTEMRKYNEANR
jgi:hypothetical protein